MSRDIDMVVSACVAAEKVCFDHERRRKEFPKEN